MITLLDFGTFPIWHREADLHIIDLNTPGKAGKWISQQRDGQLPYLVVEREIAGLQ
ncbi:MAG: hypothetical protein IPI69_10230 [Bacteroidales bacterium]|nr:hypothetical protein [Bacteroidales bacterium]